jgi:methylphosphotriester-DNA--protein-cysteine methyltransferase
MIGVKNSEGEIKTPRRVRASKFNRTEKWLAKNDHTNQCVYIANVKTKILHHPDCRHVKRMLPENQLITDNLQALYRPCSHCTPDKGSIQTLLQLSNLQEKAMVCEDPSILKIFETGCPTHGTSHGQIKMYPDNTHGQKIKGEIEI